MQISSDFCRIQHNHNQCLINDSNPVKKYKYSTFSLKTIQQSDNLYLQNTYYKPVNTISFTAKSIATVARRYQGEILAVFSDVDGTIRHKSDCISQFTKDSIFRLYENRIPFVLVTGRCYKDTIPIVEQFSQSHGNKRPDYIISSLGGCITDKNGLELKKVVIDKQEGKNLVKWYKKELAKNKSIYLIMYFDDNPYSDRPIQYPWKTRQLIQNLYNFDYILDSDLPLNKIVLYDTNKAIYNIDKAIDRLEDTYGVHNLQLQKVDSKFYEFYEKGVSKSGAIQEVLKFLHLRPNNVMAIGDSSNDIDMLRYIRLNGGLSVAMGGSPEEVIACSNAVTDSVRNDGFANCIKYIFAK